MAAENIKDFRLGLDARKFYLSAPSGSLTTANNCHVTQGGELEKRKAFVANSYTAQYVGKTYGFQSSPDGIYLFGAYTVVGISFQRSRTSNVATVYIPRTSVCATTSIVGNHINTSGFGGTGYNLSNVAITAKVDDTTTYVALSYASTGPDEALTDDFTGRVIRTADVISSPFLYQIIVHPSYTPSGAGQFAPTMNGIVSSTLFGRYPFVIAKFTDGSVLPYYNGVPVPDGYLGLEFFGTDSAANTLLTQMSIVIDDSGIYTSTVPSAGVFDIFSIPTALNGTPFTVDALVTSLNGTITPAQQTTGQAATVAQQAVGSFQIVKAGTGTQATGTLTNSTDANMADGETVVVGTITYTCKTTMGAAYDFQRSGGSRAVTLANLAAAINASGTAGVEYFAGTVANPTVKCSALNNTTTAGPTTHYTLSLAAITDGTAGNSIALGTSSSGNLVRSAATLLGAIDSKVNQIVVNGATNLLSSAVTFSTDETTFAAAIVAAINSNVASGYQANSTGGTVNILAQVAGSTPNGFTIQVQSQGTVICGTGAFSLTGSGFTMDFCKANGVDLLNNVSPYLITDTTLMTYPLVPGQVLADFCRNVANSINSGTSTHGYQCFCAQGSVSLYLCKATTISGDKQQVLDVSVTPTSGQTGSAIPVTVTPLTVTLDTNAVAIGVGGKSAQVTATVAGGVAPYTYNWTQQGQNAIGVTANQAKKAATTFSSATNVTIQTQLQQYNRLKTISGTQAQTYLDNHPALAAYLAATQTNQVAFVCVVTDALGQIATSDPVYITLLGN